MRFTEAPIAGIWVLELEPSVDDRGWFARTFDAQEFAARGMSSSVPQCNASFTSRRGTIRGMHYQGDPDGESKLVRCVRGAIFDVGVDLRPESSTYCRWFGLELRADGPRMLYLPVGVAHGLQALSDECEVLYMMGHRFVPDAQRGVRWDDPSFAIDWPLPVTSISEKDRSYPDFNA
jgi:dTDP-4-dehydrorhamnose 3,5-epimerase